MEQICCSSLKLKKFHFNYIVPNPGNLGNIYKPCQSTDRNKDLGKLSHPMKVTEKDTKFAAFKINCLLQAALNSVLLYTLFAMNFHIKEFLLNCINYILITHFSGVMLYFLSLSIVLSTVLYCPAKYDSHTKGKFTNKSHKIKIHK